MWISRKDYDEHLNQVFVANVLIQSYKHLEEQAESLTKERDDLSWRLTDAITEGVQQEQKNRLLAKEIEQLKSRNETATMNRCVNWLKEALYALQSGCMVQGEILIQEVLEELEVEK